VASVTSHKALIPDGSLKLEDKVEAKNLTIVKSVVPSDLKN
jgi:hypothetical protein